MATLAEKIRACLALNEKASASVFIGSYSPLALEADDLTTIADALEGRDASESRGQAAALHTEITKLRAQVDERVSVVEAVRWKEESVGALRAELDAAKAEAAALRGKLEKSVGVAEAVAWMGERLSFTNSKVVAQGWSESGVSVVPLYAHPPAPEALPTREDLETVLRETARLGDVPLGDAFALAEDDGVFCVYDPKQEAEGLTFAEAVAKAAALLRGKKVEG